MRATEFITEVGDKPYKLPMRWRAGEKSVILPSGRKLTIDIQKNDDVALVNFFVDGTQDITGQGDAFKIFSTVNNAVNQYVGKNKPDIIAFTGNSSQPSRIKLYDRLVARWLQNPALMNYEDITNDEDIWPEDLYYKLDDMQNIEGQKVYVLARYM
jgi:hypothetical protein